MPKTEPVPAAENFRTNLRRVMERKEITQRALAEKAGMTYPYINRILVGKAEHPSIDVCEKLAAKVGYKLADLIVDPKHFR